jgi:glycerophosphoryl diester phosphodiesterase
MNVRVELTRDTAMRRQVDVIGHRGARGLFPENTLEGFRAAHALGIRAFELDVGVTADGVVVVSHDLALNPSITRDATGAWLSGPGPLIRDLTFEALRRFDVGRIRPGTSYARLHRAQAPYDGARVPTLCAVLTALPEARFIIELKTDPRQPDRTVPPEQMAEAVTRIIDRTGAADRVTIESFDWRGPRHVRRLRPNMRLAWLTRAETVRDRALWWDGDCLDRFAGSVPAAVATERGAAVAVARRVVVPSTTGATGAAAREDRACGADTWAPAWETLTRAETEAAHNLGLSVVPWTVNRRVDMRRLIGWGVDGLITDRPDRALAEVHSSGVC